MRRLQGASFAPDQAEVIASAPTLFDRLGFACACGRHVPGLRFSFFPSTMYIEGKCPACGPTHAIFAPPLSRVAPPAPLTPEQTAIVEEVHELMIAQRSPCDAHDLDEPDVLSGTTIDEVLAITQETRCS